MSKTTWVCFDCRLAVRRDTQHDAAVVCSHCREPCTCLGYKIPVPPKSEIKAWKTLREQLRNERRDDREKAFVQGIRLRHELEQEIRKLENLPENKGRAIAIRKLRKKLDQS